MKDYPFKNNQLILFQGDSITDCGRRKLDPSTLGNGYVRIIAERLNALLPDHNLKYLNRGVSGNRTSDLIVRWDADCISIQPDWVSLLAGVNNTWRRYDSNIISSIKDFTHEYRLLLERTRNETNARIVLCEPFLLHVSKERETWREDLQLKIEAVRALAEEYRTILVPLDMKFQEACSLHPPEYWAGDGVHPSDAGHELIAQTWIEAVTRAG
jgi:lysophospholipase L1-like esterase